MSTASERGGPSADGPVDLAVVIACRDVAGSLPAQLDALVAETWSRPWAVVVVDNGSTDATPAIASSYAERGVRLVPASDGTGAGYVRNTGVRAVESRAVAFCDGDDIVHPGWVAAMGDALVDHPIVVGALEADSLNADWLAASRPLRADGTLVRFASAPLISGGNCGFTREVYEQLGGFDEDYAGLEDIELSLRAAAAGLEPVREPDAVVAYRYRESFAAIWRQGLSYGKSMPTLIRRAEALGLPAPSRWAGLRSWAWMVTRVPSLRTKAGRAACLWVLAVRVGVLRQAIELRSPYV